MTVMNVEERRQKMPLNKPSGNMYPWAWTWNPYGGLCPYACEYCYARNKIAPWLERMGILKYVGEPRLMEKELNIKLVKPKDGKLIFVESNGDLFGYWVPENDILRILEHCRCFNHEYLFQSKNPERFLDFLDWFPQKSILGTTIESNRDYGVTLAPSPEERFQYMTKIPWKRKMVSIEPIMDFDLPILLSWIGAINPEFISIGADSGENKLKEPNSEKLQSFIWQAELMTEVRLKKNLSRITALKET